MSKSINKNKKMKIFTKRNIVISVILLLIATPFAVYGYNKWLDARDYERFMTVRGDVEKLKEELEIALPNIEWNLTALCTRAHLTFGDGDASCDAELLGEIQVSSTTETRQYINKFDAVLSARNDLVTQTEMGIEKPSGFVDSLSPGYIGGSYYSNKTRMICGPIEEIVTSSGKIKLRLFFSCGDNSRDTWFPRSDK